MGRARKLLGQLWDEYGDDALRIVKQITGQDAPPRPRYVRTKKGGDTLIHREGVKPERNPAARSAKTIDDLRVLIRDPKTNPARRAVDAESMRVRGRPTTPDEPMPKTSLRRQAGIGRVYQAAAEDAPGYKNAVFEAYGRQMPDVVEGAGAQNLDQLTEAAYRSLGEDVRRQFDSLPVTMRYHDGSGEYPVPSAMFRDVLGEGNLNVFSGGEPHEFLSEIDPHTGLSLNEMFRAVHDYYGHVAPGTTFRPGGEEIAYATHQRTLPPLSQIALLSETRGQNSLVNYSPLNADRIAEMKDLEAIKASAIREARMRGLSTPDIDPNINTRLRELGSQFEYAPQRALALPPEYLDPMSSGSVPDYLRDIIKPRAGGPEERAVHLSHTPGLSMTDPGMYGTGHRGDDWRMGGNSAIPRTHFYLGPEGSVRPEEAVAEVSPHVYEARLKDLYDIGTDPEGLVKLARAYNLPHLMGTPEGRSAIPDFEFLLREYGYPGYKDRHAKGRSAAVFDPVGVEFRPEWTRAPYADGGSVHG